MCGSREDERMDLIISNIVKFNEFNKLNLTISELFNSYELDKCIDMLRIKLTIVTKIYNNNIGIADIDGTNSNESDGIIYRELGSINNFKSLIASLQNGNFNNVNSKCLICKSYENILPSKDVCRLCYSNIMFSSNNNCQECGCNKRDNFISTLTIKDNDKLIKYNLCYKCEWEVMQPIRVEKGHICKKCGINNMEYHNYTHYPSGDVDIRCSTDIR